MKPKIANKRTITDIDKAMKLGEVYRMLPIIQTSPIFTVTMAFFLVRKFEKLTWKIPTGCLMTVGGALLVNLKW